MNADRSNARLESGFTLLEILVATLAFSLMLAAVHSIYSWAGQLRNGATARVKDVRSLTRVESVIREDLQNAILSGGFLAASLQGSPRGMDSRYPGYLRLTTTAEPGTKDDAFGDVQEVEYYVTENKAEGSRREGLLVRAQYRNLLGPIREASHTEILMSDVDAMEVEFYDGQNWRTEWEWVEASSEIPTAIRMTVVRSKESAGTEFHHPLVVLVPWPTKPFVDQPASADTGETPAGTTPGTPGGGNS